MLKNAKRFVQTFKNYASYIHTFSLTDNFQNPRKKGKKREKKLSFRSSLPEVFYKKGVLKTFAKFAGKHLRQTGQSLFFNKVASLRPAALLKMRLWHRCFSVTFPRFFRKPVFKEHLWWLFLIFTNIRLTVLPSFSLLFVSVSV